jgi:HAD superfamily hydrolase (TIGR01450 family)
VTRTVICDLDGVVYRGSEALPGAAGALERLVTSGFRIVFVTNNSSRTEAQIADKLEALVGHRPSRDDIVTSARAALALVPEGARCLVVGGEGIIEAIDSAGLFVTEDPEDADCVIVGLDRGFDYQRMDNAARAIRAGALFVATNVDPTFPAEDSIRPGAGAIVAALETASGVRPIVAGKPEQPVRDLIRGRGVDEAWVIGDRPDTDIAMAVAEDGWTSILVLTGVTPEGGDIGGADHVVADLAAAVDLVIARDNEQ